MNLMIPKENIMINKFKHYTLADLGTVITGKTPSTSNPSFWNGNIPFITPKDLQTTKHIIKTERTITDYGRDSIKGCILPKDSISVSCIGNLGYVGKTTKESVTNQQINSIIPNNLVDSDFLYYLLKSMWSYFKHYEGQSTALSILNKTQFEKIQVNIPEDIDVQKKIAGVLSALDDKIELNNQINSNLEQQTQALFKKYFINQLFPGTDQYLGNVCSCTLGGTPSRAKPEYWNGNIPWINSGEANKFRIIEASENITSLGLSKSATKLLPAKTTVIAITGATLGQVSLLEIPACTNQSLVGVIPNDKLPYEFIYPFIKNKIPELLSHQTGGAQQHINKQNVESLKIRVPDKDILNAYIKNVAPIYATITKNCFENSALTKIRDSLLPKLMSGEIDVSKVDIEQIINNKD